MSDFARRNAIRFWMGRSIDELIAAEFTVGRTSMLESSAYYGRGATFMLIVNRSKGCVNCVCVHTDDSRTDPEFQS